MRRFLTIGCPWTSKCASRRRSRRSYRHGVVCFPGLSSDGRKHPSHDLRGDFTSSPPSFSHPCSLAYAKKGDLQSSEPKFYSLAMNPEKRKISTTTDGNPPREGFEDARAPAPINPATGQHEAYYILSAEERAKGFVRPVRRTYAHVGKSVCGKREPSPEKTLGAIVRICALPVGHSGECFSVTQQLSRPAAARVERSHVLGGCGTETSMEQTIAETYARSEILWFYFLLPLPWALPSRRARRVLLGGKWHAFGSTGWHMTSYADLGTLRRTNASALSGTQ